MSDLISSRPGQTTRLEVTQYVDLLAVFTAAQTEVSRLRQEVRESKNPSLQRRVDRFFEKSAASGQPKKIEAAVIAFIESGDAEAFYKARGRDQLLKPVEDEGSDLALRFAAAVRATDTAGAAFMLAHKKFLDWKRSVAVVLTPDAYKLIDVELAMQLESLGKTAAMVWASVVRFPAYGIIAAKEAAARKTAPATKPADTAAPTADGSNAS